jgi:hypothetical protein
MINKINFPMTLKQFETYINQRLRMLEENSTQEVSEAVQSSTLSSQQSGGDIPDF